jgi:hypothetical protein
VRKRHLLKATPSARVAQSALGDEATGTKYRSPMPKISKTFPLADLTTSAAFGLEPQHEVDPHRLASELSKIINTLAPVLCDLPETVIGLTEVEIALTIGAEGGVWFVAKGSAEASIRLRFSRER